MVHVSALDEAQLKSIGPKFLTAKTEVGSCRWYYDVDFPHKDSRISVTTINGIFSKGAFFYLWVKEHTGEFIDATLERTATFGTNAHCLTMYLDFGHELDLGYAGVDFDFQLPSLTPDENGEYPLTGEVIPIDDRMRQAITNYYNWVMAYNPKIIASELVLYDPKCPVAGQVDLIAVIDGELWIIDRKTGKEWPEHQIQLSWYAYLVEQIYDLQVDHVASLYFGTSGNGMRKSAKLQPMDRLPTDMLMSQVKWLEHYASKKKLIPAYPKEIKYTQTFKLPNPLQEVK